jgi:hypothetical protein
MYTCPTDIEAGIFTVLNEQSAPLGEVATNSYAANFGALGLLNTNPDDGNGMFQRNSRIRSFEVRDGITHTLAIGERSATLSRTPWAGVMSGGTAQTTPGAPVYTAITELAPVMVLARVGNKPLLDPFCEPYDFFSAHHGVVNFAFTDGSVHALRTGLSVHVLQALATRAGNEPIGSEF